MVLPVEMPEPPGELVFLTPVDGGHCPGTLVEPHFDPRDPGAPSCREPYTGRS